MASAAVDDFNYPMAKRTDTMFLRTFEGPKSHVVGSPGPMHSLQTGDIPGAQAGTLGALRTFKPKPSSSLDVSDIPGSSPTKRIPTAVNKVNDRHLSTRDIEGSYAVNRDRIHRHIDPLVPTYNLPAVTHRPVTPPVQLRESLKIDDIAGARPHYKISTEKPAKSIMDIADLPLAHSGTDAKSRMKHRGKDRPVDNPTAEFGALDHEFRTNRRTHPLSPSYRWDTAYVAEPLGGIPGAQPRGPRQGRQPETILLSLRSTDIPGAQPCVKLPSPGRTRRQYRNPVDVSDIPAAHPTQVHSTFHRDYKGQTSQRCVDPVSPVYKPLAWKPKDQRVPPAAVDVAGTSWGGA